MKKIIIIISHPRLKLSLVLFLLITFIFTLSSIHVSLTPQILSVSNSSDTTIEDLKQENRRLKGVLDGMYPFDKSLDENNCEGRQSSQSTYKIYSISQVISKGESLPFEIIYNDSKYLRPVYDSAWRDFYFRGWLNVPYRICDARHKLFVFYGGASNLFDFEGEQSLEIKKANVDYHRNINFLAYDFNVKEIKIFNNQILLIGEPQSLGVQIAAIRVNDVLPKEVDHKDFLFQIATPTGYEIDYLYGSYTRSDYLKKIEPVFTSNFFVNSDNLLEELQKENTLLKKELAFYIPLDEDIRMTEEICPGRISKKILESRPITPEVQEQRIDLPYTIHFSNLEYERPIYHPVWKENYKRGFAYVPQKICDALHNIFILPSDKTKQKNLLVNLAFFEKFEPVKENQIGLLIYDLDIKSVKIYNDKVFIIGIPSRTGAQIISIDKTFLKGGMDYTFYLETIDGFQTDGIYIN